MATSPTVHDLLAPPNAELHGRDATAVPSPAAPPHAPESWLQTEPLGDMRSKVSIMRGTGADMSVAVELLRLGRAPDLSLDRADAEVADNRFGCCAGTTGAAPAVARSAGSALNCWLRATRSILKRGTAECRRNVGEGAGDTKSPSPSDDESLSYAVESEDTEAARASSSLPSGRRGK
eukprot:CAMPEP_0176302102 /NCGR_PEP_ID=MMETSP0121_2-20121125/61204_1 /TAXON_ID=160619 /ORGANISM="Kryptoperidinium foliaceum, Strain CCMP 1326" /LENGTH=177 /DNA_ID=CAMNT_0017643591 /DNA_START=117 /DNA_END=648 /DNA_ORIENTATION=+